LRRVEKTAEGDTVVLVLPDTGEEVRVPFDAPMAWAVAEWRRETGQDVEPDPMVDRMTELMARGAYEKNPDQDGRILSGGSGGH
jgi:hypothetical protein